MYVYVSVCNSDYLSTRCVLAELAKSSKQATPNGPKQALQTLSATATAAATTTQNGHKKMKISTLEIMRQTSLKHAASPTTGWANKEQGGGKEEVPLQGGAKFHVAIALHNSGSQNRRGDHTP